MSARQPQDDPITAPALSGAEAWLDPFWDGDSWDAVNIEHGLATIILALRFLPYPEYLRTNHWAAVRYQNLQ